MLLWLFATALALRRPYLGELDRESTSTAGRPHHGHIPRAMIRLSFTGHRAFGFNGTTEIPTKVPHVGNRGASILVGDNRDDKDLLFWCSSVGSLGVDGDAKSMWQGDVPGVGPAIEEKFGRAFAADPDVPRRQVGAPRRAPIVLVPYVAEDKHDAADGRPARLCAAVASATPNVVVLPLLRRGALTGRRPPGVGAGELYVEHAQRPGAGAVVIVVAEDTQADLRGALRVLGALPATRRPQALVAFREKGASYPFATQATLRPDVRGWCAPGVRTAGHATRAAAARAPLARRARR